MKTSKLITALIQNGALLGVLAILIAVFSWRSQNFFQASTAVSIANQIPDLTFIAVGMTLVLIIGGIDLSVGSLLAFSSAVVGVLIVDWGWPFWAALPLCLAAGASCGLFNGAIAIGFRVPSFIVTLGMMEIARGSAKTLTNSQTKYIGAPVEAFSEPLPVVQASPAFLLAIAAVFTAHIVLTRTAFGRYCVAIGGNAEAARLSGVQAGPYSIAVFGVSGLLCALAGLAQTSRLASADPNAGMGIELSAIAACVIGGTSLMGGRGSVISSFIGVLIIAVLQTGLAQVGVSDANKQIITGVVIVVAVLLDSARSRFGR